MQISSFFFQKLNFVSQIITILETKTNPIASFVVICSLQTYTSFYLMTLTLFLLHAQNIMILHLSHLSFLTI